MRYAVYGSQTPVGVTAHAHHSPSNVYYEHKDLTNRYKPTEYLMVRYYEHKYLTNRYKPTEYLMVRYYEHEYLTNRYKPTEYLMVRYYKHEYLAGTVQWIVISINY
jgi:hypothetical protein